MQPYLHHHLITWHLLFYDTDLCYCVCLHIQLSACLPICEHESTIWVLIFLQALLFLAWYVKVREAEKLWYVVWVLKLSLSTFSIWLHTQLTTYWLPKWLVNCISIISLSVLSLTDRWSLPHYHFVSEWFTSLIDFRWFYISNLH